MKWKHKAFGELGEKFGHCLAGPWTLTDGMPSVDMELHWEDAFWGADVRGDQSKSKQHFEYASFLLFC